MSYYKPKHQSEQPGLQKKMHPQPESIRPTYRGTGKLADRVALITGGDSGIGRSIAYHFAREGANVAFFYLDEYDDANETKEWIINEGRRCQAYTFNLSDKEKCLSAVKQVIADFGKIDVLVNNAAEQHSKSNMEDITLEQLEKVFETNFFSHFHLTQLVLPLLSSGGTIINTTSVTAYEGSGHLVDYAATKGAIVTFTRSLARLLAEKGIRVNGVAPGPVWTPLIPATFDEKQIDDFGKKTLMKRAAQPSEIGPTYVFLASSDASFMTGQILHLDGGSTMCS